MASNVNNDAADCNTALGMENRLIKDVQITASDFYAEGYYAKEARLNNNRYWATKNPNPSDPWIQVDFLDTITITGLHIQGGASSELVTKLQIQYGDTENSLQFIMDGSANKTYDANSDRDTIVTITFPQPVRARFLRIVPTKWRSWIGMRFEVIGCRYHKAADCNTDLGMESRLIKDEQITASEFCPGYPANAGRLNNNRYWCTRNASPSDPWIQVDFLDAVTITGIRIQGPYSVTKLQIQYGDTENSLKFIMDGSVRKTFDANSDRQTIVIITFPQPIRARFFRIVPTEWHFGYVGIRFEVIGCRYHKAADCNTALGMQSRLIKDEQITASEFCPGYPANEGRLNNTNYWCTRNASPSDPWIQVDFLDTVTITGIRIQGPYWVTKLQIQYGDTENSLKFIMDGSVHKTFDANSDGYTIVIITFPQPIRARFLRIVPTEWHSGYVGIRFEVIGCRYHKAADCTTDLGMESRLIKDEQITASEFCPGYPANAGRLNNNNYWCTSYASPSDSWIQVDFLDTVTITGIRIQGGTYYWVTKLQIQYGDTDNSLKFILDGSVHKTFDANSDGKTIVTITFPQPIRARLFRIVPTKWHAWLALRFEVIGCRYQEACNHTQCLTDSEGNITSINYPNDYNSNANDSWLITAEEGERITIAFTDFALQSSTHCTDDAVSVYDGNTTSDSLMEKMCGSSPEPCITSSSNNLLITFYSDDSSEDKGFYLNYNLIGDCGCQFDACFVFDTEGMLVSPNYPSDYPNDMTVTVLIEAPEGQTVTISFHDFEVEYDSTCSKDFVVLYDGDTTDNTTEIGTYCGTNSPGNITSSSKNLLVYFLKRIPLQRKRISCIIYFSRYLNVQSEMYQIVYKGAKGSECNDD
ncbi:uncharacterized protein [Amphiura filiformis]|uniref:uncharacterized protein n=1 Tax=Amphiura filiformis TaxID=82378 RepID=UPI003B21A286